MCEAVKRGQEENVTSMSGLTGGEGFKPGCLVSMYEDERATKHNIVMSMFTSGASGMSAAALVEIPCIKRNVSGVMIAFSSADIVLAGIKAHIPVDECILAMRNVGEILSPALKETAQGGLASTPTGKALKEKIFGCDKI